jgi:hypothetical protein
MTTHEIERGGVRYRVELAEDYAAISQWKTHKRLPGGGYWGRPSGMTMKLRQALTAEAREREVNAK